jgi:hypothetical protein
MSAACTPQFAADNAAYASNPIRAVINGVSDEDCAEIERGAYVRVLDPHERFYRMCEQYALQSGGTHRRKSSHASIKTQYEIVEGNHVILFGYIQESTFFQLERFSSWTAPFRHFLTWVGYEISNENFGPAGVSRRTERNPIVVDVHVFQKK